MKRILNILREIRQKKSHYTPIIEVVISKSALLHNLKEFQKTYPAMQFAPVLKSNAYGHGLVTVAKILEHETIAFFAVDSLYEANVLRASHVHAPILIMDYTPVQNIVNARHMNIAFAITSLMQLQELVKAKHATTIHLKVDTGMHRQGFLPEEIDTMIKIIKENSQIHIEGIFSHFANAHRADKQSETHAQIACWETMVAQIKSQIMGIKYFHLANTAGTHFMKDATCNVGRVGIGMLGHNPSPFTQMNLQPALRLETIIGGVKKIHQGDCVGYNNSFCAPGEMTIATIPLRYFEGIDRRLSNKGVVQVRGIDCPIIGDVSMNITSIDVSQIDGIQLNEKVIVISDRATDKNSEENIAAQIGEIPYVILSRIPGHLHRRVG